MVCRPALPLEPAGSEHLVAEATGSPQLMQALCLLSPSSPKAVSPSSFSQVTQVRLKPLLSLPGLRQIYIEPTGVLRCKSAVCGLNGHRSYYVISLFKVTYESTIQLSRNSHALFTKTLENSDSCGFNGK